ncbi:hypothetical protein GCK72_025698 [Caenorhabditis remanei]|nr:hypothetical protein GCK72_025698 [Caenorhabditis remanei]KAF1749231.1 hypothetical protein GCK72_025698 [Caenorhabditis remanei]
MKWLSFNDPDFCLPRNQMSFIQASILRSDKENDIYVPLVGGLLMFYISITFQRGNIVMRCFAIADLTVAILRFCHLEFC